MPHKDRKRVLIGGPFPLVTEVICMCVHIEFKQKPLVSLAVFVKLERTSPVHRRCGACGSVVISPQAFLGLEGVCVLQTKEF